MVLCVIIFLGIFAFAGGIYMLAEMPGTLTLVVEGIIPVPIVVMVGGFLVALISLLCLRSMGVTASDETPKTIYQTINSLMYFGLFASVAMCAYQIYLRIEYESASFFVQNGAEELLELFQNDTLDCTQGKMLVAYVALALFIGLPWFILSFYAADFTEYVTVTRVQMDNGESYESHRSDSYLPIAQFVILGILCTAPILWLATSYIAFLYPIAFGFYVFMKNRKPKTKDGTQN